MLSNRFAQLIVFILLYLLIHKADAMIPECGPIQGNYQMTVYGIAFIGDKQIDDSNYYIAAHKTEDEGICLGISKFFEFMGEWVYYLSIQNDENNIEISFKIFHEEEDLTHSIQDKIIFQDQKRVEKNLDIPLKINSVYPTLGKAGKNIALKISGKGFSNQTKMITYLDAFNRRSIISTINLPGESYRIAYAENHLLASVRNKGVYIINVESPETPTIEYFISTNDDAKEVVWEKPYIYIANGSSGLMIFKFDPLIKEIVGVVDTPGWAVGVAVSDSYAYVADWKEGIQVIDIKNPQQPELISSLKIEGEHEMAQTAFSIFVNNHVGYIVNGIGLQIVDLKDPKNPKEISFLKTPGQAKDIYIHQSSAYIADGHTGVLQVDISNPIVPMITTTIGTVGYANAVYVDNKNVYVADNKLGIQIISIEVEQSNKVTGSIDTPGNARDIVVNNSLTAYVADDSEGVQILNLQREKDCIGLLNTPGLAKNVSIINNTAFVADWFSGIHAIDISSIGSPKILNSYKTPGCAFKSLLYNEMILLVADGNSGMQVYEINLSGQLNKLSTIDTPGNAKDISFLEPFVYIADGTSGVQIIDISTIDFPEIVGNIPTKSKSISVNINDNYLFVCNENLGMSIYDISKKNNPRFIHNIDASQASDAVKNGPYVYLADGTNGLHIIDMYEKKIIKSLKLHGISMDASIYKNTLFISLGKEGICLLDITDADNPVVAGYLSTPSRSVAVTEDLLYTVFDDLGLMIVPLPTIKKPESYSQSELFLNLKGSRYTGHYTISVFDFDKHNSLPGAITFKKDIPDSKAIIANGSDSAIYTDDLIWNETNMCSNYAYDALIYQGFQKENIYYLSQDTTLRNVNSKLTAYNLKKAIINWASDAEDVLLFLTGHGSDGKFRLNEKEVLQVQELNEYFNQLEKSLASNVLNNKKWNVIFIYDACYSGTFVKELKPDQKQNRIIITSASNERAVYQNQGGVSFSFLFWAYIFKGAYLSDAFYYARDMMKTLTLNQTAMLDVDGNGEYNEEDGLILDAENVIIGRGYRPKSDVPYISEISHPVKLETNQKSEEIWAGPIIDCDDIEQVWAIIYPPCFYRGNLESPITDLPSIELAGPDEKNIFKATYDKFDTKGKYMIIVYAKDVNHIYSLPKITQFVKTDGKESVQTIPLHQGWNQISFNINKCFYVNEKPDINYRDGIKFVIAKSIGDVLKTIENEYSYVRSYDHTGALTYNGTFFSNLDYLAPEHDYWIKIKNDANFDKKGFVYLELKGECLSR